MNFHTILLLIFVLANGFIPQQQVIDETLVAFREADASKLQKQMSAEITLLLPASDEKKESRVIAAQKLALFFKNNPPKQVKLIHRGPGDGVQSFAIIDYQEQGGKRFRISVYYKTEQQQKRIYELKVEKS